ncbi:hypothetical protein [Anaerostipes caccae]|nr:hypothetical protein [Anaerostipes caccae]
MGIRRVSIPMACGQWTTGAGTWKHRPGDAGDQAMAGGFLWDWRKE